MIASLWVAELVVSDATAQKLAGKHQLDVIGGRRCIAVLCPVGAVRSDMFALGAAYPEPTGAS